MAVIENNGTILIHGHLRFVYLLYNNDILCVNSVLHFLPFSIWNKFDLHTMLYACCELLHVNKVACEVQ